MTEHVPSTERMSVWLRSSDVVDVSGDVTSWWNPQNPGYAYPEIAGLLLSLLSQDAVDDEVRQRIAQRLVENVGAIGAVGRWGTHYVFDTAMALSGLIVHETAGGEVPDESVDAMFNFIHDTLRSRRGVQASATGDPTHWSLSYGAHLLKVSFAITAYEIRTHDRRCSGLIDQLLEDLAPLCSGGRFRVNASQDTSYLHAHCYALEGMLRMRDRSSRAAELLDDGVAWLASIQDPEGGIHAWHDGQKAQGAIHADCTAQAARLWASVDPERYSSQVTSALGFLASLQSPQGGLYYEPGSADVNTWCTIFALQSTRWASKGAVPWMLI